MKLVNYIIFLFALLCARLSGRKYRMAYGRLQVWENGRWMNLDDHVRLDHQEDK